MSREKKRIFNTRIPFFRFKRRGKSPDLPQFFKSKKQKKQDEISQYSECAETNSMLLGVLCLLIPGAVRPVIQRAAENLNGIADYNPYGNDAYGGASIDRASKDGALITGGIANFIACYKLLDGVRTTSFENVAAGAPNKEPVVRITVSPFF